MRVKIKCFGIARDIVGESEYSYAFDANAVSVGDIRQHIHDQHPEFVKIKGFMIAINHEYASDDMILSEGDELAIIPPVSGG